MSIEEWIRNREWHGQVTFSAAEVREAFPTHSNGSTLKIASFRPLKVSDY